MTRKTKTTLYASAAALALVTGADRGFAAEPGNFSATLSGITDGAALAVAPPPGFYANINEVFSPNTIVGTGHNTGVSVGGVTVLDPSLTWSSGWKFLGGSYVASVIQPFFWLTAFPTGATNPYPAPAPFGLNEDIHNTIVAQRLSWNLGGGWFSSLGFKVDIADGSRFIGQAAPDYWTYAPTAALAYISPNWKLTANFVYDINGPSAGFTGAIGGTPFGTGYRTGDQFYADIALLARMGKWEFGPVANFAYQTTADKPGGGFSCAQMATLTGGLAQCGLDSAVSLGAFVDYNFGPVTLAVWATDDVWNRDNFKNNAAVFTRLTFKLWGDEPAPMLTKAISPRY
jgi:hypothetical protein